jgi:hypothetical protein
VRPSPPDAFSHTDAADLTPFDCNARFFGRLSEGIQTPLSRTLLITRHQLFCSPLQTPRRGLVHQGNDPAVILGGQAAGSPSFRPVSQPFDPFCIEPMESAPNRLWATIQMLCNGFHSLAIPTPYNYLSMKNPVGWSMAAGRQFADPSFFLLIVCCSQNLRHLVRPFQLK